MSGGGASRQPKRGLGGQLGVVSELEPVVWAGQGRAEQEDHSLWVAPVPAHPHVSYCLQDLPGAGHPGSHWEQLGALLSWPRWGLAQVSAVDCRTPHREGWRLSASFQASCTL